ncbi:MAG: hypothetical protein L7U72_18390 [Rubripirellula sp.]|nr:hypothetical protein [Rubripirellula sp.]
MLKQLATIAGDCYVSDKTTAVDPDNTGVKKRVYDDGRNFIAINVDATQSFIRDDGYMHPSCWIKLVVSLPIVDDQ